MAERASQEPARRSAEDSDGQAQLLRSEMHGLTPAARKRRRERLEAEQRWLETPVQNVTDALLELTHLIVDRQLATREGLNGRLTGAMTFAGALLALALAFGQKASPSGLHHARHELFVVGLITTVVLLAAALLTAILGLRPGPRRHISIRVLKHYGMTGAEEREIREDRYRFEVALADQLGAGNAVRARHLLWAQGITALALVVAAAVAVIAIS